MPVNGWVWVMEKSDSELVLRKSTSMRKPLDSQSLALDIARVGLEHKAENTEIIDVRDKVDYADFIIVMSGRGERHVAALARNIDDSLRKSGSRCQSVEGLPQGSWVLMDYGDVVIHIFHEDARGYYDLASLWMDARRVLVDDGHGVPAAQGG